MNTLTDLRATIRKTLASTSDWPDATLDAWIAEAIRFYSAQFPRHWRHTINLTTDTQAYALPATHGAPQILAVEYPAGETPTSYLRQADEWSQEFQDQDNVYAMRGIDDDTAIESDTSAGLIVFAETVATGESAIVHYLAPHPVPTAGDDDAQITVPRQHYEAITAYVEFRSTAELEFDEATTVDTSNVSIVLAQLGQAARQAWIRYKEVIDRLTYLESGQSEMTSWISADPRIY